MTKLRLQLNLLIYIFRYDNQNIRKLFNGIDENRDGFIQFPELLSRFDEIDTNNDGNVTIDECLASKPSEMSLNEIESYFKFYDELDGAADGVVRRAVIQRIQFLIDANNDGKISFKEYKKSCLQMLSGLKEKIDTSSDTSSED
ncbi:probable calcium-binding protein CML27 [Pomacea canaliculata]|uniref:probable calcium-binding protein CML27 n=1 Tax=Pomacea canaliculata TaxID=400727 RepID=UPI000D72DAE7|nr:probable calcium-binding protein CML27 [Pomacea canaliculata]